MIPDTPRVLWKAAKLPVSRWKSLPSPRCCAESLCSTRASCAAFTSRMARADSFLGAHLNVESAREAGAQVLTYHKVERLLLTEGASQRVIGAICQDLVNDEQVTITADLVVNAAGAWAGKIAASAGVEVKIIAGKGTMLAMNQRIVHTVINRCHMPADGDILVPAHTVSVIGTTDVKVPDPDHFAIEPWEVNLCWKKATSWCPVSRRCACCAPGLVCARSTRRRQSR